MYRLGLNLGSQVLGYVCVCVLVFLKTCQAWRVSQKVVLDFHDWSVKKRQSVLEKSSQTLVLWVDQETVCGVS